MRICYLPGRERSYSRTRVFCKAMRDAGIDVLDCSSSRKSFLRYLTSFYKFLKYKRSSDLICVGFLGHFIVPAVKMFTRKKVLFDAFVSVHRTMVEDRQRFKAGGIFAKLAQYIDKRACSLADRVFVDTEQDIRYFTERYGIEKKRFCRLYASADDSIVYPRPAPPENEFTAAFYGEFQKLHGVSYVIEAAALLPDVKFILIGKGPEHRRCVVRTEELGLKNVVFIPWVEYRKIPDYMARASVCLGIFGNTPKTQMVIPIKVYEALAMRKAVITADTPASRELLTSEESAMLCRGSDGRALADAIRRLRDDPQLRAAIAEKGYDLFKKTCSPAVIGKKIRAVAEEVLAA